MRESDHSVDEGGPGVILQDVYRSLGHDAVIMPNAEKVFRGMVIPNNTTHIATFDARRVRDYHKAKFDPKKRDSKNWLAVAGRAEAGAFSKQDEEEK